MDYLSRGSAPFSDELWGKIDEAVITSARRVLVGRRFLNLYGPLGPTVPGVFIDDLRVKKEDEEDGEIATSSARKYKELPIIKADFTLSWRDLELAGGVYPVEQPTKPQQKLPPLKTGLYSLAAKSSALTAF